MLFRVKKQRRRRRSRHLKASKLPTLWRIGEVQRQVGNSCIACLDIQRSKLFFLTHFFSLCQGGLLTWRTTRVADEVFYSPRSRYHCSITRQRGLIIFLGLVFPEAENRLVPMTQTLCIPEDLLTLATKIMGRYIDTGGIRGKQRKDNIRLQ